MTGDGQGIAPLLPRVGGRARRVLAELGIDAVPKLLELTRHEVLQAHFSGVKTWEEIRNLQCVARNGCALPSSQHEAALAPATHTIEPIPDSARSSFECIIRYWLTQAINTDRTRRIMEMRLGVGVEEPCTLERCANVMGLTRERVRQIQVRADQTLHRPEIVAKILEFWTWVTLCVESAGGVMSLTELGLALMRRAQWTQPPGPKALAAVLEYCPAFKVSGDAVVGQGKSECTECSNLVEAISGLIASRSEIPMAEINDSLVANCGNCPNVPVETPRAFSSLFIERVVRLSESLRGMAKFHDGILCSRHVWAFRLAPLHQAVAAVLERAGRPMHFAEVTDELRRLRGEAITERGIHGALARSADVVLWDRGTYIHADHIKAPEQLLAEIEQWLVDELRKGTPCLSVAGVFGVFETRCREADVTSESALYGCLRKSSNSALAFPHYPYIYLRRRGLKHVPAYLVIDEWLQKAGGPVPSARLTDFACREMCLKRFQLQTIKRQLPNVVLTDSLEYLHGSLLSFGKDEVTPLVSHARKLLSSSASVSIVRLYQEKQVTCHSMGITGPRMLFSVLQNFASDTLDCAGYPTVRLQDAQEGGAWRGVVGEVEAYLQAQKRPCSTDEISEEFVDRLGYRPTTVFSIQYRGNVFRYLEGCLVHRETMGWDAHKQSRVAEILRETCREARAAGERYAEIERIIESQEDRLPPLAHGLPWTETLLADLTSRSDEFLLLGSARNALVTKPNDDGIASFEDLVMMILKDNYRGAANLEEFANALRARRIILKSLTSFMLGNQSRVVIAGHEIMLKELA